MFRSVGFRIVCGLGIALGLCQCDKASALHQAPKPVAAPYDVTLKLTPEAVRMLSGAKHTVHINGYYYGMPTKAALPEANQIHQIELGDDNYIFAPALITKAHMPGQNMDRSRLGDIVGREPYLLISASSADAAGNPDEWLECTNFRGTLTRAQTVPIEISCVLIPPPSAKVP